MRRVVDSVSSNVALPVLPEARIDMRNEMQRPQPVKFYERMDDGKVARRGQRKNKQMKKRLSYS